MCLSTKPVGGILVHIEFIALYGQFQDIEDIEDKTRYSSAAERLKHRLLSYDQQWSEL